MKVSELIEQLQNVMKTDGDVKVFCYPYDGQMNPTKAETCEIRREKVIAWNPTRNDWDRIDCKPFIVIE